MDLLRAAFLLESEIAELPSLPAWRRRELENIAHVSIRAMREAAERIEQLESLQRPPAVARSGEDDDLNRALVSRGW